MAGEEGQASCVWQAGEEGQASCVWQVRRDRPPVCGRQVRRAGYIAGERRENDVRVRSEVLNYSVVLNFFHFQDTYANVHVCTVCNIT